MVDPGDGTEIYMDSAQLSEGLYHVPGKKYGLVHGEVLKLNCVTGEVLGIVRQP
jgi:hypothetical protein